MALRHTISPQISNRSSPPITRSVSRNGHRQPLDTSTPLTRRSIQPGMDIGSIGTIERVYEAADDTDIDLNSSKFIYKEHFTVKEMTSMKKEMWYDWLVYHIRMFRRHLLPEFRTVREMFVVLILIAMLSKYARDCFDEPHHVDQPPVNPQTNFDFDSKWRSEIQRIEQSISNLQNSIDDHNKQLEGHLVLLSNEDKGWKESIIEEIKKSKEWQAEMDQKVEFIKKDLEEITLSKVIITEEKQPADPPIFSDTSNILPHPIHYTRRSPIGVNVANSLIGASIDDSCSSRPVSAKDGIFYDVMSYFGTFKEGYVLLDRDVLTPGEAWCTYDKRPTLTVQLARFILPTAVSYQHVRWNGIVPNHAPKIYDLVACLDPCCMESEPLVSNCEYKASEDGNDEQEQFCSIPTIEGLPPVNHVQFRFRENHGNMKKTCAYLVRVYGHPMDPPPPPPVETEEHHTTTVNASDNGTSPNLESTLVNSMAEHSQ